MPLTHSPIRCEVDVEEQCKWKVTGPDTQGEDLRLIIAIEHNAIIVTVF